MKSKFVVIISAFILITLEGCATVFKGYEDDVTLYNASRGLRVFTKDSVEIPLQTTIFNEHRELKEVQSNGIVHYYDTLVVVGEINKVNLRSNTDHLLILKYQDKEKRVHIYPKISTSWFILDLFTGGFLVDAYTGNWNSFDDVDASFSK
jgi:hypothetical protein